MRGRRTVAAVTGIVLALPVAAALPGSAATARTARPSTATIAEPSVPCPTPAVTRSPRPSPPPADQTAREIGGAALATPALVVPPGAQRPPAVTATSWVVADLDSGAVLGGCGPHEASPPASVQKLLLAATVLAKLDPKQNVTITREDLNFEPGSSAVGLLEGGHYSVETLWLGLMLNSGNDAANVLARLGGGAAGVAGTLREMNEQAGRLGARQTHAATPSGLDGPGQFTSAYDLALIARACFADEAFRRYTSTERAQIPAQPPKTKTGFQIQNDNTLLFRYPGAIGGKTGFTDRARHTYVGAAKRNGRRLVVTLLGAEARPLRGWQQGAALLDWGFAQPKDASVGRLVQAGEAEPASPAPKAVNGAASGTSVAGAAWTARSAMITLAAVLGATALVLVAVAIRRRRRRRVGRRRARAR